MRDAICPGETQAQMNSLALVFKTHNTTNDPLTKESRENPSKVGQEESFSFIFAACRVTCLELAWFTSNQKTLHILEKKMALHL